MVQIQPEQRELHHSNGQQSSGEKVGNLVKSPLVGTFYAAPSEDAEPFIKVGDTLKKGQTLAIVEAMKLMNAIESELDGVVTEILVENEENVEVLDSRYSEFSNTDKI